MTSIVLTSHVSSSQQVLRNVTNQPNGFGPFVFIVVDGETSLRPVYLATGMKYSAQYFAASSGWMYFLAFKLGFVSHGSLKPRRYSILTSSFD